MILQRILFILGISLIVVVKGADTIHGVIPACPLKCLREVVSASTCDQNDVECKCNNPDVYQKTTKCVLQNCSLSQGVILSKVHAEICQRPQQSRQDTIRLSLIGPAIIVLITSITRYLSCWKVRGEFFLEDYLIFIALLMYCILQGLVFRIVDLGFGTHVYQLNPVLVGQILKIFFIAENIYAVEVIVIKISLCCFFLRIFPQRIFRICCYSLIIYMAILAAVWVLLLVFQCKPITSNWNINIEHPRCYNIQIYSYVGAAAAMSQDACILALPMPLVLKLKISTRKKIGVIIMFSLGVFVTITSAIRTKAIKYLGVSSDPSWDNIDITIWTSMEISVGLICCNMPANAGLITHIRRKIFSSRTGALTPSEPKISSNSSIKHSISRPWSRACILPNAAKRNKILPKISTRIYSDADLERGNSTRVKKTETRYNSSPDSEKWLAETHWLDAYAADMHKEFPLPPNASLPTHIPVMEDRSDDLERYGLRIPARKILPINSTLRNLESGIMVKRDFILEEDIIEESMCWSTSPDDISVISESRGCSTKKAQVDDIRVEDSTGNQPKQLNHVTTTSTPTRGITHQGYQHDESLDLLVYQTFFRPRTINS